MLATSEREVRDATAQRFGISKRPVLIHMLAHLIEGIKKKPQKKGKSESIIFTYIIHNTILIAGIKKKRRRKGKRKSRKPKDGAGSHATPHMSSSAMSEAHKFSAKADHIFGGWNKVELLGPAPGGSGSKGTSGKGGEKGRGKRSKRKKDRGGKDALNVLRVVDMASYLAKGERAHGYLLGSHRVY